jgi:hypothetical protein
VIGIVAVVVPSVNTMLFPLNEILASFLLGTLSKANKSPVNGEVVGLIHPSNVILNWVFCIHLFVVLICEVPSKYNP